MEKKTTGKATGVGGKPITRKEAIKKTGLIAASAATAMILLGSPKAQACSPAPDQQPPQQSGGGHHDWRHHD